jgi:hypothetical protein
LRLSREKRRHETKHGVKGRLSQPSWRGETGFETGFPRWKTAGDGMRYVSCTTQSELRLQISLSPLPNINRKRVQLLQRRPGGTRNARSDSGPPGAQQRPFVRGQQQRRPRPPEHPDEGRTRGVSLTRRRSRPGDGRWRRGPAASASASASAAAPAFIWRRRTPGFLPPRQQPRSPAPAAAGKVTGNLSARSSTCPPSCADLPKRAALLRAAESNSRDPTN